MNCCLVLEFYHFPVIVPVILVAVESFYCGLVFMLSPFTVVSFVVSVAVLCCPC